MEAEWYIYATSVGFPLKRKVVGQSIKDRFTEKHQLKRRDTVFRRRGGIVFIFDTEARALLCTRFVVIYSSKST